MSRPDKRATIKDVAVAAGISPTTVSQALNGKGTVRKETVELVRRVAREVGYRPHALARGLRTSDFRILALVIRPLNALDSVLPQGGDNFMRFAGAASLAAMEHGYTLMLLADPTRSDTPNSALAANAFIITQPYENDPILTMLLEAQIPFVTTGVDPARPDDFPAITFGTGSELRVMLTHLLEAGASKVALVTGTDSSSWNLDSQVEYQKWCEEHAQEPKLMSLPETLGEKAGEKVMERLFDSVALNEQPDAVLCLTGRHAAGVLEATKTRNISVPNDLLIAAFAGAVQNQTSSPTVTAFDLQPERAGKIAVDIAINLAEGKSVPSLSNGPVPILHERESTQRSAPKN